MKLYSITTSERNSRPAKKGGDGYIEIELYRGNRKVAHVKLEERPSGRCILSWQYLGDGTAGEERQPFETLQIF